MIFALPCKDLLRAVGPAPGTQALEKSRVTDLMRVRVKAKSLDGGIDGAFAGTHHGEVASPQTAPPAQVAAAYQLLAPARWKISGREEAD
jgi:hypothetical protein